MLQPRKRIFYIYSLLTLFIHLLSLSLVLYRMEVISELSLSESDRLSYITGILGYAFYALYIFFILVMAIMLIVDRIDLKQYLHIHGDFLIIQILGFLTFRLIVKNITEYASMDLYWRLIKLISSEIVSYLLLVPILIKIAFCLIKGRIHIKKSDDSIF